MPISRLLFLFALFTAACAVAAEPTPTISYDEYQLCGIRIGATLSDVASVLGEPSKSHVQESPTFCEREEEQQWSGFSASFCDNELINLTVTSKKCATPSGVRVGLEMNTAFDILGPTKQSSMPNGETRLRYWLKDTDCYLLLTASDGRITEIQLWCDST